MVVYEKETPIGNIYLTKKCLAEIDDKTLRNILERFVQDDFGIVSKNEVKDNHCSLRVQQGSVYARYDFESEDLVVVMKFDVEDDCHAVTMVLFASEEDDLDEIIEEAFKKEGEIKYGTI